MYQGLEYIAGFFDGEGSIGIYPRKDRKAFHLKTQLVQNRSVTVAALMSDLIREFGGNCSSQLSLSGKIKYNWQLTGDKAVIFLRKIVPYLRLKKEQAQIAIRWQNARPKVIRNSLGQIQTNRPNDVRHDREIAKQLVALKG